MAPLDNAGNFDRQAVTSSIGTADPETIDVTDASTLPDPSTDQYNIVIWDAGSHARPDQDPNVEIARVTSRDTGADTITVDRAQEGTSNSSHPSSSELLSGFTAKMVSDLETFLNEIADFSASPTEVTAPVNNSSVQTDDLDLKGDNAAPFMQNAVVAPLLDDPIYPLSNYADMAAATNQVFTDLDQSGIFNPGNVYLPPVAQFVGEAVSFPTSPTDWKTYPTLIGHENQTAFKPASGFADNNIIEVPANTNNSVKGPTLIGITASDAKDRMSGWAFSLLDQGRIKMHRCGSFIAGTGQSGCVRAEAVNTSTVDFMNVRDCEIEGFRGGQHGIKSSHGQFHMSGTNVSGSGPNPNGICVEISQPNKPKNGNHISGWISQADVGVRVVSPKNQSNEPASHYISVRVEAPGNDVAVPIEVKGHESVTVAPKNSPAPQYRHSTINSTNTTWVTDTVRERYELNTGANLPGYYTGTSGVSLNNRDIRIGGGDRIDMGGNKPFTNQKNSVPQIAPAMQARFSPNGETRVGFVESRWTDWFGIYYNGTNYRFRAVQGGTTEIDVDSNIDISFNHETVRVKYDPDGIHFALFDANNRETTYHSGTVPSNYTAIEPVFSKTGGGGSMQVLDSYCQFINDQDV